MLFVSNNRHHLNITVTNSELHISKGRLKKYSSHDFYSITGGLAATGASFICGAILALIMAISAGATGFTIGIILWKVGIAQASANMILVGQIFTYFGIGSAGLFGIATLLVTTSGALVLGYATNEVIAEDSNI